MKQFIRDYLTFNKREKNGVFVFIALITLLIGYLNWCNEAAVPAKVDFTEFKKKIQILENTNAAVAPAGSARPGRSRRYTYTHKEVPVIYFDFNPNHLPEKEWKKLGLTGKQIRCIKNYETSGGTFRRKADLKKIYLLPEKLYNKLEPYICIPENTGIAGERFPDSNKNKMIDLNSADSALLVQLKGIGPFYAKAIIGYRNRLGGFVSKQQLLEIWKFDDNKLREIEKYIVIDTSKIKKININDTSLTALKHPYLKWATGKVIINYRLKHGPYATIAEIKKTEVVSDETFDKVAPYLTTE